MTYSMHTWNWNWNLTLLALFLIISLNFHFTYQKDDDEPIDNADGDAGSKTADGDDDADSKNADGDDDADSKNADGDADADSKNADGDADADSKNSDGDGDADSKNAGGDADADSNNVDGDADSKNADGDADADSKTAHGDADPKKSGTAAKAGSKTSTDTKSDGAKTGAESDSNKKTDKAASSSETVDNKTKIQTGEPGTGGKGANVTGTKATKCSTVPQVVNLIRPKLTVEQHKKYHRDLLANGNKSANSLRINSFYGRIRDYFYVKNNGHEVTIQFEEESATSEMIILTAPGVDNEYVLAMGKLMWAGGDLNAQGDGDDDDDDDSNIDGSQHAINGERYAAELQLIHYRKQLKSLEGAKDANGGILVLCILFDIATESNQDLAPIIHGLVFLTATPGKLQSVHGPLELKKLGFQLGPLNYHEYSAWFGLSSWANPCAITSKWLVFDGTSYISWEQINDLANIVNSKGIPYGKHYSRMSGPPALASTSPTNPSSGPKPSLSPSPSPSGVKFHWHYTDELVWEQDKHELSVCVRVTITSVKLSTLVGLGVLIRIV